MNEMHVLWYRNLNRSRGDCIVVMDCVPVCGRVGMGDVQMVIPAVLELLPSSKHFQK